MDSREEQVALRSTVDLVRTPYVVNILDSLHHGRQPVPVTSVPGERDALAVAVQILAEGGVVAELPSGGSRAGETSEHALALTELGRDVAAIVADLCRKS